MHPAHRLKRILTVLVCSIMGVLIAGTFTCHSPTGPAPGSGNGEYPTRLLPLASAELSALQAGFDSLNDTHIDARLDQYGLVGDIAIGELHGSTIQDPGEAVSKAKNAFVKFSKFTNVSDTSDLTVYNVIREPEGSWVINFAPQVFNGFTVLTTYALAVVEREVVRIGGHHYKNIFIPPSGTIEKARAVNGLLGYRYTYVCWSLDSVTVTTDIVKYDQIGMAVWIKTTGSALEFRLAWEIPVVDEVGFLFYTDIVTGELLTVRPMFIC